MNMKSRANKLASTLAALAVASPFAISSAGCADQEQSFYVQGLAGTDEETGACQTVEDNPIGLYTISTSGLNAVGVLIGCVQFNSRLARPNEISSVEDSTNPWAIVLERAEIDVVRGDTTIESFDISLAGRVGDATGGQGSGGVSYPIPLMSAATGTTLAGGLAAGEQTQLDVQVRGFGHTAGGLDLETEPFSVPVIFINQ